MHVAEDKSQFLRELTQMIHRCVKEIRNMEKPVIAAVNGHAFGAGLSLALACDIIIAVKDAKLGTAFIGIGLTPEEAFDLGIINKIVESGELDEAVEEFANKFRKLAPIAVGKAKMLINKSMENDMATHLELESKTAALSAGSEDFKEGVAAFVEKRKPVFKGK